MPGLDPDKLKRSKPKKEEETPPEKEEKVSAGKVDKLVDFIFNPSREKMREVTIIDRMQGRLFPLLDMVNAGRKYCMEIALYRQNPIEYRRLALQYSKPAQPTPPDLLDEFLFRTAQWQKSVAGKNLERGMDMVLAEIETRQEEVDNYGSADKYFDE